MSSNKALSVSSDRPLSIEELLALSTVTWHPTRHGATSYMRATENLYQQALVYQAEGDLQTTWLALAKAAKLAIDYLPNHPGWILITNSRKDAFRKRAKDILDLMASIKPTLVKNYEDYQKSIAAIATNQSTAESSKSGRSTPISDEIPPSLPAGKPLQRREKTPIAELQRAAEKATHFAERTIAYIPTHLQHRPQSGLHFFASKPVSPPSSLGDADTQAIASILANDFSKWKPFSTSSPKRPSVLDATHQSEQGYTPSKVRPVPFQYPEIKPFTPPPSFQLAQLPAKPPHYDGMPIPSRPPLPLFTEPAALPSRPTKVDNDFLRANDMPTTEDGTPLRPVYLPDDLIDSFVALAIPNTDRKIETCGLLLGTLSQNTFTVTTLLIPQQVGKENEVEMLSEEMIFEYQDSRNLLSIGWIHSHPTQTCFLSSVDLHTQSGYQLSLSEGIAIVVAPTSKDSAIGIFRLTAPPGLDIISHCQERGFHPHPAVAIYTDADGPKGHVRKQKLPLKIVDIRSK